MGHPADYLSSLTSSAGIGSCSELEAVPKGWQEADLTDMSMRNGPPDEVIPP